MAKTGRFISNVRKSVRGGVRRCAAVRGGARLLVDDAHGSHGIIIVFAPHAHALLAS